MYTARIYWKGRQLYLGRYNWKEDAEDACVEWRGRLENGEDPPHSGRWSKDRGVYPSGKRWVVNITWRGERKYYGVWEKKEDALAERDRAIKELIKEKEL